MRLKALCVVVAASLLVVGCNQDTVEPAKPTVPTTEKEKQAYSVGVRMGEQLKEVSDEINSLQSDFDIDMYLLGLSDQVRGTVQLSEDDVKAISHSFQEEFREIHRHKEEAEKAGRLDVANAFLAQNKIKDGVVTTDSGLQYKVLKEGEGATPGEKDKVSVLYTGRLVEGEVFDSTSDGKPRSFALNRVVKGWTEGIQLMKKGAKYEFYIPPVLGYGEQGNARIPGNSVLIFEVELMDIIESKPPVEKSKK